MASTVSPAPAPAPPPRVAPAPAPAAAEAHAAATPQPVGTPASAAATPAAAPLAAAPAGGAPDAGARVGHDVATAPTLPASAPRLNLELVRPRGGELSGRRSAGVLAVMPRPPELPDKLAKDIEKSAHADCRTAHADKGLLAVPALAAEALKDNGCRW
jgi:hypothetical protein